MAPRTRASAMGAGKPPRPSSERPTLTRRDAREEAPEAAPGTIKRKGSDLEEILANASHYVKEFGRHDAYAGGEQVRGLEVALELETARRRERARSRAEMNDERWTDEGVV